jgi:uncharacterized surface protein with fasciclin (FAS1) repeats
MDRMTWRSLLLAGVLACSAASAAWAKDYNGSDRPTPPSPPIGQATHNGTLGGKAGSDSQTALYDQLSSSGNYSNFLRAVDAADLRDKFGTDRYTVFVPTDEAFAAMPQGVWDIMLLPENKPLLRQWVNYYVVPGNYDQDRLHSMKRIKTLGGNVTLTYKDGTLTYGETPVGRDVYVTRNGTIYTVDNVVFPKPVLVALKGQGYEVAYSSSGNWGRVMSSTRHQTSHKSKHHRVRHARRHHRHHQSR